jgi:hypothetical protein
MKKYLEGGGLIVAECKAESRVGRGGVARELRMRQQGERDELAMDHEGVLIKAAVFSVNFALRCDGWR